MFWVPFGEQSCRVHVGAGPYQDSYDFHIAVPHCVHQDGLVVVVAWSLVKGAWGVGVNPCVHVALHGFGVAGPHCGEQKPLTIVDVQMWVSGLCVSEVQA